MGAVEVRGGLEDRKTGRGEEGWRMRSRGRFGESRVSGSFFLASSAVEMSNEFMNCRF